jgi:hypothetical protein
VSRCQWRLWHRGHSYCFTIPILVVFEFFMHRLRSDCLLESLRLKLWHLVAVKLWDPCHCSGWITYFIFTQRWVNLLFKRSVDLFLQNFYSSLFLESIYLLVKESLSLFICFHLFFDGKAGSFTPCWQHFDLIFKLINVCLIFLHLIVNLFRGRWLLRLWLFELGHFNYGHNLFWSFLL